MNHYEFEMPIDFKNSDDRRFDKVAEMILNASKGHFILNKTDNPKMIILSSNEFLTFELAFKLGIIFGKFY